jgi:hypothetical protein
VERSVAGKHPRVVKYSASILEISIECSFYRRSLSLHETIRIGEYWKGLEPREEPSERISGEQASSKDQ